MRSRSPLLLLLLLLLVSPRGARADWNPPGVDLSRPRLLFAADELPAIQERVAREPYRTVVRRMYGRITQVQSIALDDHGVSNGMLKSRAARNLAFLYAIDRTWNGSNVVPFASAEARKAAGDRVRELLVHMFTHSRLRVPPPIGGWDRDITTSEELLQYASAYDAMLGAGYDFGDDRATIESNLVNLASELYEDYIDGLANDHQNNHRSKSGAALAVAAIALAEYTPPPGSDPRGSRDPEIWLGYGLDLVDVVIRWTTVTGDGAYAEGPFYWRFTAQNLIPFARAWDRLLGGATVHVRGLDIPSLWRHPLFARTQRWMLDMTLPDGTMAPIDDSNPGRAYYFGAMPPGLSDPGAYAFRWRESDPAWETEGNIDLAADSIVIGDPEAPPSVPTGSPTAFYVEGGQAIFRSDWSEDAIYALALAEHDTASLFGRDRNGRGVVPQSHDHADPGSFLMHAFGERLMIDPGYVSFPQRSLVNQPRHHNMILVDGRGPLDPLLASFFMWARDLDARPPTDGQATLSYTLDTGFLDAATATVRYGLQLSGPPTEDLPLIRRRFLFPDHRYLLIADSVDARPGGGRTLTWLLHGNGGGSNGGSFEMSTTGARWSRDRARLDVGMDFDVTPTPTFTTQMANHEDPGKVVATHPVLEATVSGERVRATTILYPTRTGDAPPALADLAVPGVAGMRLTDAGGDRRIAFLHRPVAGSSLLLPAADTGLRDAEMDGSTVLFDAHGDGRLRLAWAEEAKSLRYDGVTLLESATPARLGITLATDRAELVVESEATDVVVRGLGFVPQAADGACGLRVTPEGAVVTLGRERRFVLRAAGGNAQPAADPGPDLHTSPGQIAPIDGTRSCDADGDALTPHWELVSAPAGSDWSLAHPDAWQPGLLTDVVGPYRLRLVVTDARGAQSRPVEVLVVTGPVCSNGMDDDLDGFFDHPEDPGCASPQWPTEGPRCSDGLDDDGDGLVDFPADPECLGPHSLREDQVTCGLGFELAFLLPPLFWLRGRRARHA